MKTQKKAMWRHRSCFWTFPCVLQFTPSFLSFFFAPIYPATLFCLVLLPYPVSWDKLGAGRIKSSTVPYFSGGVLARLFPTALGKLRRKRYKGVVGNNLEKEKCAGNHGKANKQEVTAGDLPHLNPLLSKKSITWPSQTKSNLTA